MKFELLYHTSNSFCNCIVLWKLMKEVASKKEWKMLMKPTTEKEERRRITCHSYLSSQLHEKLLGSFRPSCVHDSCQFLSEFESIQNFSSIRKINNWPCIIRRLVRIIYVSPKLPNNFSKLRVIEMVLAHAWYSKWQDALISLYFLFKSCVRRT